MLLKNYFAKFLGRISDDFKQKELIPLKVVFFVQASTLSVLYPYLTIHMRELGINVEETAIMSAVIPVIGIIIPPLAGMVADKIGNFKLLLAFFSFIGGAFALLLLLVPVGRITVTYPETITLNVGCGGLPQGNQSDLSSGVFELGVSKNLPCHQVSELNDSFATPFDLNYTRYEGCGYVCRSPNQTRKFQLMDLENSSSTIQDDVILTGRSYTIQIRTDSQVKSHHYNLAKNDVPKTRTKEDILSQRIMPNEKHLGTSIRMVAPSWYYFPASDFSGLTCRKIDREVLPAEEAGGGGEEQEEVKERIVCSIGSRDENNLLAFANSSLQFSLRKNSDAESSSEMLSQFFSDFADLSNSNESHVGRVTCQIPKKKDVTVFVYLHNPENNLQVLETLPLAECQPRCLVTTLRKSLCTNIKQEVIYDPELTFWSYLVIRVFIGIIGSTSYAMYEVAVIAILREQKADYGLQRIYASIGGMIASPLSGILIDYASEGKGYTDFRPAFYLYAGLKMSTSILMLFMNLEFKKAATNVVADAIQVLKNLEVIALLTACFVLGTFWGYIESFLFWFLEDLGGTRSLMGITITVGGIAGIPLLILSGPIIDKIGHANVIFIGLLFYAIRLVGYSVIYNPYHCLFFEAMESITSSLAITAAVTYAAKLSTTTTDGSIQGLVGGLYFGVGRGAGSLIGGYLMKAFGTRQTYRIFAVLSVIIGFAYYFFNQFCIVKRSQVEESDVSKDSKPVKNVDADVLVIPQKPKDGGKGYGTIQLDNSSSGVEREKNKDTAKVEDEKSREKQQLRDAEMQSHNNPAYVPDNDEEKKKD